MEGIFKRGQPRKDRTCFTKDLFNLFLRCSFPWKNCSFYFRREFFCAHFLRRRERILFLLRIFAHFELSTLKFLSSFFFTKTFFLFFRATFLDLYQQKIEGITDVEKCDHCSFQKKRFIVWCWWFNRNELTMPVIDELPPDQKNSFIIFSFWTTTIKKNLKSKMSNVHHELLVYQKKITKLLLSKMKSHTNYWDKIR